jgi:hypothetical protein
LAFDRINLDFIGTMFVWNCLTAKACEFCCAQETGYITLGERYSFNADRKRHDGRD